MRKTKIGSLLVIAILALAGIGVAYAGFTDTLTIKGDVDTATVSMEVVAYSGTYVYKVWVDAGKTFPDIPNDWDAAIVEEYDHDEEVLMLKGFMSELPTEAEVLDWAAQYNGFYAELVSFAKAQHYDGDDYDVHMVYDNLFPCKNFTADFVIHYTGSVPAKLWATISETSNDQWLEDLYNAGEIKINAYEVDGDGDGIWEMSDIDKDSPVDIGHQVHTGDSIYIEISIHLPQDNKLKDLDGEFFATITALQWNEDMNDLNNGAI